MKAEIDRDGHFYLHRNGIIKEQLCPYVFPHPTCGDWCPKFQVFPDLNLGPECVAIINCCGTEIKVSELIDERQGK